MRTVAIVVVAAMSVACNKDTPTPDAGDLFRHPDLLFTRPCPFEETCRRPRDPDCEWRECPCSIGPDCYDHGNPEACPNDFKCYWCGMGCDGDPDLLMPKRD